MKAHHAKELTKQFWDNLIMSEVETAATKGHSRTTITRPWLTSCQIMRLAPPKFVIASWREDGFDVSIHEEYIAIGWD